MNAENPTTWFVRATVTAHIKARNQGDAMQQLCDRLGRSEHGAPYDYEVNTVDAERISLPLPTKESEAGVDELLRLAEPPSRDKDGGPPSAAEMEAMGIRSIISPDSGGWHGWLERGVWRSV